MMEYRKLGRTDLHVSSIGMGCVTFGREIDEATSFQVMDHALEQGITLFDTAEAYANGRSEEVVGAWMKARGTRAKIVLATKKLPPSTPAAIVDSVEASLRRLQTETIDLYQLHAWDPNTPLESTLETLGKLVDAGKIRYLGCSNFAAWQLCKALWRAEIHHWPRLESIQPNYNLVVRDIEKELLPLCADQEIGVISYSPLGAGFLTGKYRQGAPEPEGTRFDILPGHQRVYYHDVGFRIMERLRTKAAETGRTMINLALAWVIGQPGITSVLVGARHTGHVDQAFEAEQAGLSDELRMTLNTL
ncbi:MAG: aldo/keto reductase [Caldilineaceae bacterium]|nr:aldo/keto reductase [Caldilineaceae bacterium]